MSVTGPLANGAGDTEMLTQEEYPGHVGCILLGDSKSSNGIDSSPLCWTVAKQDGSAPRNEICFASSKQKSTMPWYHQIPRIISCGCGNQCRFAPVHLDFLWGMKATSQKGALPTIGRMYGHEEDCRCKCFATSWWGAKRPRPNGRHRRHVGCYAETHIAHRHL